MSPLLSLKMPEYSWIEIRECDALFLIIIIEVDKFLVN